ncbi:heat shock protein DnaJ [Musa troglodytarum]|uniref:Heat shock protein DnaJ n=1 Tax=Musa troglodytarum TaxID=320322 RepID=A0A9E7I6S9_9LILI|nr:heat shock protein DnaJ [Musa troglodytarum]
MGGIDLFKQGCVWVQFQKQDFVSDRVAASHAVEKLTTLIDRHWPLVYSWCTIVAICDCTDEGTHVKEQKESKQVMEDFSVDSEDSPPTKEAEDAVYSKSFCTITKASNLSNAKKDASSSKVVIMEPTSLVEMERIMNSSNHYEVLGLLRNKSVDHNILKKEYHKKVLSDLTKKKNYDEQLRKEEHGREYQRPSVISQQGGAEFHPEESRCIQCTKCGNSHIWICTNRSKSRARWCQDCSQYHQAKDGDGWVESGCQPVVMTLQKMEIPRAFVCAESKVFDVSEWAICQYSNKGNVAGLFFFGRVVVKLRGMTCRSNTHGPSFHVNMVALDSTGLRSNSSTYSWGLDAKLVVEDDEFELWLQEALASGIFSETPKRRKSWPFKINQKGMKPWRRSP